MRITSPPWKASFNYVLVSMCGVQFWTISWLVLSSWKVVLRRSIPQFSAGGIALTFGGCAFEFWINKVVCISNMTAPPHSSRQVSNFLNYLFPGRWMGCGGPHNWPVRSPDSSPLDYCIWGWMKKLVYSVKVVTRDALFGRILDAADCIRNSQRKL